MKFDIECKGTSIGCVLYPKPAVLNFKLSTLKNFNTTENIQGEHSGCNKPPVDIKTHVPF